MKVKTDALCNIDDTMRTTWVILFEDDDDYSRSQSHPRQADATDLAIRDALKCTRYEYSDLEAIGTAEL